MSHVAAQDFDIWIITSACLSGAHIIYMIQAAGNMYEENVFWGKQPAATLGQFSQWLLTETML